MNTQAVVAGHNMQPPALATIANSLTPPSSAARQIRHDLRRVAASLLPRERVAGCGRRIIGSQASIIVGQAGAHMAGLETCGSVWLCPVCAGKIAEGRRRDVEALLERHTARGGAVYMALFTIPHGYGDFLRPLRDKIALAWSKMVNGAPWKRCMAEYGIPGVVRALEVMHGRNGWHPHLHVLIPADDLSAEQEEALRLWLFERWAKVCQRVGIEDELSFQAFGLQRANDNRAAGEYVSKWGADAELTKWHVKKGKGGSRSPWDLLRAAAEGDGEAAFRFREYAGVFKSKRQLTWSRGLREAYALDAEICDEKLAEAHGGGEIIGHLRRAVFRRVYAAGLIPLVLEEAERGGWSAVLALLRERRLALPEGNTWARRVAERS